MMMMADEAHQEEDKIMEPKDQTQIIMKGKRTKRPRPQSPLALGMVYSCSSSLESGGEGERIFSTNSPTTSVEFATTTEQEEDMANCLILLAQGDAKKISSSSSSHPLDQPATTSKAAAVATGLYVYQCKTCNRCFPSFQALGGHRASHKKPKVINNNNIEASKKAFVLMDEEDDRFSNMSTTLSLQMANNRDAANLCARTNNKANKVHECSICGAEFSSGQALGGHMRRHRAFTTSTTALSMGTSSSLDRQSQQAKKPRNILQLDLNLPAPEDDRHESKFAFASKEQVIIFSASPLVDCHY